MILQLLSTDPILALVIAAAIIITIAGHEFAHALAGYLLGDHTAEREGRLTLNPLAHLDLIGTILIFTVGFGWGRPVPFNPFNLRWRKWGATAVALAGPISNFIMAYVFFFAGVLALQLYDPENYVVKMFGTLAFINVALGVFNLLPIPPLDGSRLLVTLLPPRYDYIGQWLERNGFWLLIFLLIIANTTGINFLSGAVNGVFDLMFGWY